MQIQVIRTDGTEEIHEAKFEDIEKLINASFLDTVNLRDGRMMLVDDNGYETTTEEKPAFGNYAFIVELKPKKAKKPVNEKATKLYHSVCVPGTTHQIVGDVAIVVDKDV